MQVAIKANSQENVELILRKAKELGIMQKVLTATNHNGQTPIEDAIMTGNFNYCQEALTYMAKEKYGLTFRNIFCKKDNIFYDIPHYDIQNKDLTIQIKEIFQLIFKALSNENKKGLIGEFINYLPEDLQKEAKALSQEIQQDFKNSKKDRTIFGRKRNRPSGNTRSREILDVNGHDVKNSHINNSGQQLD